MFKFQNTRINGLRFISSTSKPPKELQLTFQAPAPKRVIGLRGNHNHGRRLYDQVYPTSKIPTAFVPRYPLDWRNAGRFVLTCGMARLENRRIHRHPLSLDYQSSGDCGPRCYGVCSNSQYKCLCSMRSDPNNDHVSSVDSMLMSFKGPVDTEKPLFSLPRPIAKKHSSKSNPLVLADHSSSYRVVRKRYRYPAFNDRENWSSSVYDDMLTRFKSFRIFDVNSD